MRVKDVLTCTLTVSKEVDSLAAKARRPEGGRGELPDAALLPRLHASAACREKRR